MVVDSGKANVEELKMVGVGLLEYKIPSPTSRVFKDECMYCFHTPLHPGMVEFCTTLLLHFLANCEM